MNKWKSTGLYEHPVAHQKGTFGNIVLSSAGVYSLKVGGSQMSCPQDWAAKIHAEETGQASPMYIRDVPKSLRQEFKVKCAQDGISMNAKVIELIENYVGIAED